MCVCVCVVVVCVCGWGGVNFLILFFIDNCLFCLKDEVALLRTEVSKMTGEIGLLEKKLSVYRLCKLLINCD